MICYLVHTHTQNVHIHACTHKKMHTCTYICTHTHNVHTHVQNHAHNQTCTHTHTHTHTTLTPIHAHTNTHTICTQKHTRTHKHTCTHSQNVHTPFSLLKYNFSFRRQTIDKIRSNKHLRFPSLNSFRWRVDVTISTR